MKYRFYINSIGYAHLSIISKYVFLLHVLNKNENIISAGYWLLSEKRKN